LSSVCSQALILTVRVLTKETPEMCVLSTLAILPATKINDEQFTTRLYNEIYYMISYIVPYLTWNNILARSDNHIRDPTAL